MYMNIKSVIRIDWATAKWICKLILRLHFSISHWLVVASLKDALGTKVKVRTICHENKTEQFDSFPRKQHFIVSCVLLLEKTIHSDMQVQMKSK